MSQFGHCPLAWICHSRALNNHTNGLHKRALSLIHNNFSSSFSELLGKDNSVKPKNIARNISPQEKQL